MIKFNSSVNINSPESFISEAEKELEKLDIFISPSSFVRQNTPQKKEESFVLKVTTTAINHAQISFSGFDDFINQAKKVSDTTTNFYNKVKGIIMPPSREDFLAQGSQLLEELLGNQAEYQTGLKRDPSLIDAIQSNTDILSDSIASNSKLSKPIKQKTQGFRQGVREYILMTAALIEKGKFEDVDQVVSSIQAGENEKRKIELLLNGYKKLSFSMETIRVTVDFFSIANKNIVDQVGLVSRTSPEFPDLMLKNAILIYELTGFLIEYLENFGISGIEDIERVRKDVQNQLSQTEKAIEEIESDPSLEADPDLKTQVLANNAERKAILGIIRQKWASFEGGITKNKESIDSTITKLVPNLKIRQKDARIQVMTLELVQLTRAFQSNIALAETFADLKKLELAPLTADDVRQLLGLETARSLKSS
jgi:hypothetical protein